MKRAVGLSISAALVVAAVAGWRFADSTDDPAPTLAVSPAQAAAPPAGGAPAARPQGAAGQWVDAWVTLVEPDIAAESRAVVNREMTTLASAFSGNKDFAPLVPKAFVQAATLARTASVPASRGIAYDVARDMLLSAVLAKGGKPEDFYVLRRWNEKDPHLRTLQPGIGLARSDIAAVERLRALDARGGFRAIPANKTSEQLVLAAWNAEREPVNRMFPTRLQSWVDGIESNWSRLSPEEQRRGVSIFTDATVPSDAMTRKAFGADNFIYWLAAVDVPMSAAERAANKELRVLLGNGVFAGPMLKPLQAIAQQRAANARSGGRALDATTAQLMRLNNWGAATGEMSSWESYRYSTEGY